MNGSQEIKQDKFTEACDKISSITDYTLKADYDVTLHSLPNPDSKEPDCVHHFKGSIKRNLLCLIAVGGLAAAVVATVIAVFHMLGYLICRK